MAVVYSYYKYIIDKENYKCYVFRNYNAKPSPNKCVLGCKRIYAKCLACALCIVVIIVAITEIAVTVTNGLATKLYSAELSGRLVAMSVLALTAAVSVASSVYALVGLIKKEKKHMHVAGVVLFVMAIIQALLCGIAVKVSPHDETTLSHSLADSFNLALEGNTRHYKLWEITNSGLECCGLNGPDDYQHGGTINVFPPDVPISCCRSYDSNRSELLQENARQECRAKRDYYLSGCGGIVKAGFRNSASVVLSTTIFFIVLEVLLAASSWVAYKKYHRQEKKNQKGECNGVHVQPVEATQEAQVTQDTQVAQVELQVPVDEKEHS